MARPIINVTMRELRTAAKAVGMRSLNSDDLCQRAIVRRIDFIGAAVRPGRSCMLDSMIEVRWEGGFPVPDEQTARRVLLAALKELAKITAEHGGK